MIYEKKYNPGFKYKRNISQYINHFRPAHSTGKKKVASGTNCQFGLERHSKLYCLMSFIYSFI